MSHRPGLFPRAWRAFALLAAIAFWSGPAVGQGFPAHVGPAARELAPDAAAIPALRFLTTPDFPPFNYRDADGEVIGFNIDLAQAICAKLSARCTVQAWPWDMAAQALADNQGDALIAGLAVSPETGARFDFSRVYLGLPARFVARQGEGGFDPAHPSGTLAVRAGSAHAEAVARYMGGARIVPFPTELEALEAVRAGGADAYFGDAMRAAFWLNDNPECCRFVGEAHFRPDLFGPGLAVAFPAGLDRVRVAVDWALIRLQREGVIDELYLRWFPVGFY